MPDVVDDWGFDEQYAVPVIQRTVRSTWPEEVARYALGIGVTVGVLIVLAAIAVTCAVLLAGLVEWALIAVWPVPGALAVVCALVGR